MAEVISCIEHQTLPVVEKRQTGEIALDKQHAETLSKLKSMPSAAFTWGHNSIKLAQYCGVVQLGDLTLEVLPKIYGKENDKGSSRAALIRMLRKAGLIKLQRLGDAGINLQRHTLLDVFILDFCTQLNTQLIQGKLRQYISIEENLPVLRGKLLANQQMRHNLAHRERLFCQYDELSEDIFINQVIKFTLRLLLPKTRSDSVKKAVRQLLYAFDGISDIHINSQKLELLIVDRTAARYKTVIDLCLLFIESLSPDTNAGKNQSFALMFDMNQLFENWVASILKPVAHKNGLRLREQGPRKYLAYRPDIDRSVFQMKPDICLLDEWGKPVLIADAKWKLLEKNEAKLGISQPDLYQMQAYASRYGVQNLALIYPQQKGMQAQYELNIQGDFPSKLNILTVDINCLAQNDFRLEVSHLLQSGSR